MFAESSRTPRAIVWTAILFCGLAFTISWWHWWTFQYGSFDLAFYVQALWLALRGKWMVSLLNVPLMGNHAEPIVFFLTPLFAVCPHPMTLVAVQVIAFGTMPFTALRIGRRLGLEPPAAICMAAATLLTPASLSIAIYEFHPEALAAPLILLLIEARLAGWRGAYWLWFLAVLAIKENMAPLLILFCAVGVVQDRKRGGAWQTYWNIAPLLVAAAWLGICAKVIGPALNGGNVDYLQLYGRLGNSGGDILVKFFTEPSRAFNALYESLSKGNMVWALFVPFLGLSLLRPRWLLIASPLLLQHLLSWRDSEWSLGAHYPAPFIPLFWIAAVEGLARLRGQNQVGVGILAACLLAHLHWGAARETLREFPALGTVLEEREWKAGLIGVVPDAARVTASIPYLSHLAKREHLVSLHHILKGLKTLSATAYVPPPPGDVVIIDYGDTMTFSTVAGYYHPKITLDAGHVIPSSDELLHEYLGQGRWSITSRNELTIFQRGEPPRPFQAPSSPMPIDDQTTLSGIEVSQPSPGALRMRLAWEFAGERVRFPWLMLALSDGKHLYPFLKGMVAPEAGPGACFEEWSVVFPSSMQPGTYSVFAILYDGNQAAWNNKLPPDNGTYIVQKPQLSNVAIKPGDFQAVLRTPGQ